METGIRQLQRWSTQRLKAASFLCTALLVLTATIAMPRTSNAAEIKLSGSGTFKPPKAEQLAALPADLGFSQSDFASGNWSFAVRYDDSIPGAESDPYTRRFNGVVRSFQLTIGSSTLDLPVDQAVIVVSDGGEGYPDRESVRVEANALTPSGLLRLRWFQANQQPKGTDLRGAVGVLPSGAMPPYLKVANLPTLNPFDRFLELRVDRPGGDPRPLLYVSSSKLTVTASPATAP
jgi:hypothetical protein